MTLRSLVLCAVLTLVPAAALAEAPTVLELDTAHSTLQYKIVHKFHEVEGKTSKLLGRVKLEPGKALVQIRAEVASFDSGNANRDSHMKETVEAAKYPDVTLKGVLEGFKAPTTFPADVPGALKGELTFHGITHPITVPVTLHFTAGDRVSAKGAFDVSLDAYQVERPSLMFVKIEDACHITADLAFVPR